MTTGRVSSTLFLWEFGATWYNSRRELLFVRHRTIRNCFTLTLKWRGRPVSIYDGSEGLYPVEISQSQSGSLLV